MAGADRVEGTLFGNGERTGNVDICTLALNMLTQGVDPRLDLSNLDEMRKVVEYCNQLPIHPRHPYAGDLVYTAFSGSHQDAIKKGFGALDVDTATSAGDYDQWEVPYLPIDPAHVGRDYEAVVRVNSQSGKGGVSFVLLHEYHLDLPRGMQVEFTNDVQAITDETSEEITSYEIYRAFQARYLEGGGAARAGLAPLQRGHRRHGADRALGDRPLGRRRPTRSGAAATARSTRSSPRCATTWACSCGWRAMPSTPSSAGSDAQAAAYIEVETGEEQRYWGCGINPNIVTASLKAVVSAVNVASQRGASLIP